MTPKVEFLNVTFYVEDTGPLRAFYHDTLGLPLDYEEPGGLAAMRQVCAHDQSEGERAGTVRLYFLSPDPASVAAAAAEAGVTGTMGTDGSGSPMWTTTDPFGNSVRIVTK